MAQRMCTVPGCARSLVACGYCSGHYQRLKKHGDVDPTRPLIQKINQYDCPPGVCAQCGNEISRPSPNQRFCASACGREWRKANNPPCSVEGCDGRAERKGMCQAHFCRQRDGRPLDAPLKRRRPWGTECEVVGCTEKSQESGLCGSHAARFRKHGDVLAHVPLRKLGPRGEGYIDGNGYRCINGEKEHRIIMRSILDRNLYPDEHVHHKNGDRQDNRPENLELWIVRRQPAGQRVADRVADAIEILDRYAPDMLVARDVQLRVA
jgi:hypothetical protein